VSPCPSRPAATENATSSPGLEPCAEVRLCGVEYQPHPRNIESAANRPSVRTTAPRDGLPARRPAR
jgi:hypothetical protein